MEHILTPDAELEQMRAQMAAISRKLADQQIVNDRLMRESMKDKLAWIKRYIKLEMIVVPFAMLLWIGISLYAHIPLWFTLILFIGCCIDIYFDWKVNVTPIESNDFDRQNLVETADKLRQMKKVRAKQTIIGVVSVWLVFVAMGVYVYLKHFRNTDFAHLSTYNLIIIGGIAGLVVGCGVGAYLTRKIFRKMQQSNDDIIRQIEEITSEE